MDLNALKTAVATLTSHLLAETSLTKRELRRHQNVVLDFIMETNDAPRSDSPIPQVPEGEPVRDAANLDLPPRNERGRYAAGNVPAATSVRDRAR